jgi:hypothetical protein
VRAPAVGTLTFKLAESLNVYGVVGEGLGRLLALRVRGQNAVLVNLPRTLVRGTTVTLTIAYGGRLAGASADREAVAVQQDMSLHEVSEAANRASSTAIAATVPQAPITDYATGVLRLTVPDMRGCVARHAGQRQPGAGHDRGPGLRYVFLVNQPARYFSAVILASRPRQRRRGHGAVAGQRGGAGQPAADGPRPRLSAQAAISPSTATLGDYPYRTLTLAAVDDALPGGTARPTSRSSTNRCRRRSSPGPTIRWRSKATRSSSPARIAHQFKNISVGWESYHEQWISEGFAQYFALLYAERSLDPARVEEIRRKLRTTATAYADQGPIWLGYRLGHLQDDGRVFRALVYNKSALVLHMLRRWVGDDAFFRGLRALYEQSRYTKIGTRHVQRVFETESGSTCPLLRRLIRTWTPRLHASFEGAGRIGGRAHRSARAGDGRPVTVSVVYASGATEDHRQAVPGIDVRAAAGLARCAASS